MKPIAAATLAVLCSVLAAPTYAQDFPAPNATPENPALNPSAARSVHLWWEAPQATAFVNTLTIDESVPGSYFMACGFVGGYFGLQELADKRRVAVFSVWDESGAPASPLQGPPERVEVLASGDGVRVSRFGGEGTGAKTVWPFAWKSGRAYTMLVRAVPDGERVIYSAYISGGGIEGWKLMASLRARAATKYLQGLYSFVEDFRRDGKSLQQARRARFGDGWVRTPSNAWLSITKARFEADANTQTNINAQVESRQEGPLRQQFFTLATGGVTRQRTPVGARLEIAPIQLPSQ